MLRQVGPYKIVRVIGRGGLGVVYQAVGPKGRSVALKLMNKPESDGLVARRLAREFEELRGIEHRNIVKVMDAGVDDDTPYLVMEFVDGLPMRRFLEVSSSNAAYVAHPPPVPSEDSSISIEADELSTVTEASVSSSLLSWIDGNDEQDSLDPRPRGKLDAPPATLAPEVRATLNRPERTLRLRDVAAQVCDGLSFIHERGLVHRDVKPSNVLVTESGCAKLVDFGLVKNAQSATHTTAVGRVVGTYRYMSPEQAKGGKVDARSDLYALGSVLYEMLCTHPPFVQNQQADLLRAIVHQAPPPIRELNPEADETLSGIAEKLLQKNPAGRFASAEEVARRLRAAGRLT